MKHLTLWLILTLIGLAVHGQSGSFHSNQIYYQEVSIRKGLNTRMIYDIIQDQHGRMLLGTDKGLYYFNGSVFSKVDCATSISPEIHNFQMHANGDIYATNFSGEVFVIRDKSMVELDFQITDFEIGRAYLLDDLLVLSGVGNYVVYDVVQQKRVPDFYLPTPSFRDLKKREEGGFFVLGFDGVLWADKEMQKLPCGYGGYFAEWKKQLFVLPLLSGLEGVAVKQGNEVICKDYLKFPMNTKIHGCALIGDRLAVYGQSGIHVYSDQDFSEYESWCEGMKVSDLFVDQIGNTWIATLGQGLLFAPSNTAYYADSHPMFSVMSFEDDYYAGDENGAVYQFDQRNQLVKKYIPQNSITEATLLKVDEASIFTNNDHFDRTTGKSIIKQYDYIKDIIRVDNGDYYMAKSYGAFFLPSKIVKASPFDYALDPAYKELTDQRTYAVMQWGEDGAVYLACRTGLLKSIDGVISPVACAQGTCRPLGFFKDGEQLLVETLDRGVMRLEGDVLVDFIDRSNGLSSNYILKLRRKDNAYFILTIDGLERYDLTTKRAKHLSSSFSLGNLRIRDFDFYHESILMATDVGLLRIGMGEQREEIPQVLIDRLVVDNLRYEPDASIEIDPGNRTVYLLFESVLYRQNDEGVVQYQVVRNGEETEWQQMPINATRLDLANLRAGHYVVRLRAGDDIRQVFGEIVELEFHVLSPWYARWYMLLLWGALVVGVVMTIALVRSRILRRKHHREMSKLVLKRELAEAKLIALRAQMNPHFMYNVMNSIQGLIYTGKHEEAGKYMAKFANLTRRFLDLSSREKISIHEENDTLKAYLELEKLRFGDEFQYHVEIGDSVDLHMDQVPTLLIQPFVENSLKHGLLHQTGKKHLEVRFSREHNVLRVEVEDNGIGRKRALEINQRRGEAAGPSYATNAIFNKVDLLNKHRKRLIQIEIIDVSPDRGTLVRIDIPDEV